MAIAEAFFSQSPIFVLFLRFVFWLFSIGKIQTWPTIIFLTESVTLKKNYWLVFYIIKDAIYLNKKYRPATLKYSSIFYCTHGLLFTRFGLPNLSWVFAAKKHISFSCIWPQKPVPFEVQVVSDNWICWSLFLDESIFYFLFFETLPN